MGKIVNKTVDVGVETYLYVRRNRVKILGTALVLTSLSTALFADGIKEHNKFLKDRGLYDEYYNRL